MKSETSHPLNLKTAETKSAICAVSREKAARDYSPQFRQRITNRFIITQSLKQTARDFGIAVRTVSEILHLASFSRSLPGVPHVSTPAVVREMPLMATKVRDAA